MEISKWHVGIVIGALMLFLLLNNFTLLYHPFSCWFNTYECGGGSGFDGNCSTALAGQVQDACCMEVDMCGGYVTEDPSSCYHRYCPESNKMCVPGNYDTATLKYQCECAYINV